MVKVTQQLLHEIIPRSTETDRKKQTNQKSKLMKY